MLSTRRFSSLKQSIRWLSSNRSKSNVIRSVCKDIDIPKIPLHELIYKNFNKLNNRTAVECLETKRKYTFDQIYKNTQSLVGFLRNSLKFKDHQTLAVVLPNLPEYPIILLAAAQANLRLTTINPNYTSAEIQKQLENSGASLIFTSTNLIPTVQKAVKDLNKNIQIIEVQRGEYSSAAGMIKFQETVAGEAFTQQLDVKWDNTLILPYSSGTTGLPKGVELTHSNLVANLYQMKAPEIRLLDEDDIEITVPAFLPFYHIYGMVVIMLQCLLSGCKIITLPQFNTDNFIALLKNYRPTHLYAVPLIVNLMTNNPNIQVEDLETLRLVMSGAAPLGAGDVERFRAKSKNKIHLIQGYGMTESSPLTLQQSLTLPFGVKIGGSGIGIPNTLYKIISAKENGTMDGLGPNSVGELLVKGPQVMKGYYNNPKATEEVLVEDGWLRTGDLAYYDDDEHFFITERLKELIKVKGFQVAPAELEEILRGHPDVEDAGVIGVPHEKLGETPKAFIVVKHGKSVKTEEIKAFVAEKVSDFKQLNGGVVIIDAIPKNPSGKILRKELRKMTNL